MKHKKIITNLVVLLLGLGGLQAQETAVTTGGDATGAGGSSSYSVGQVVYTAHTGTNGSIAQGVQQPYEISITTGVNETSINLQLSVYPNPATNFLSLNVKSEKFENLNYQLIDLQGKIIESETITATTSIIKMEELPKAIYFIRVNDNNQIIKTFKIIKN